LPRKAGLAAGSVPEALSLPEGEIDIGRAVLLVAREDRPDLDVDGYVRRLDDLAARLRRRLPPGATVHEAVSRLVEVVQPAASVAARPSVPAGGVSTLPPEIDLARILDGEPGNCLGLSLLYLAVAERVGIPMRGVSAPEHFFVRFDDGVSRVNAEPTRDGRPVPDRVYRQRRGISAESIARGVYLRSESKRQVLASLLANRAGYRALAGRLDDAFADAERALAVKPYWPQGYVNRGLAHELAGRRREADADYNRAIQIDPCCVGALNNLAALYARGRAAGPSEDTAGGQCSSEEGRPAPGDLGSAEELIQRALRLAPSRPEILETAAAVAVAQGKLRAARGRLRRALRLDPANERLAGKLNEVEARLSGGPGPEGDVR